MRGSRFVLAITLAIGLSHSQVALAAIPPQADLVLTNTVATERFVYPSLVPVTGAPGNLLGYALGVTNAGPDVAGAVTLQEEVPAGTTFVSFVQTAGPAFTCTTPASGGRGAIVCTQPASLAPSSTVTFTFWVVVDRETPVGSTIANTARVASMTLDPDLGSNTVTATHQVPAAAADLGVALSGPSAPVPAGKIIQYSIGVSNAGPDDATNVTLASEVPANTTFVSYWDASRWQTNPPATTPPVGGTGAVTVQIGTLGVRAGKNFVIQVKVNDDATIGAEIANAARVTSETSDPNSSDNSSTTTTVVAPPADLAVSGSGSPDPVAAGGTLTYVFELTNAGPPDVHDVTLNTAVPDHTTFVSFRQNTTYPVSFAYVPNSGPGTAATAKVWTLPAGATAVFTLVVNVATTATPGTVITIIATTGDNPGDPQPANDSATVTTDVGGP